MEWRRFQAAVIALPEFAQSLLLMLHSEGTRFIYRGTLRGSPGRADLSGLNCSARGWAPEPVLMEPHIGPVGGHSRLQQQVDDEISNSPPLLGLQTACEAKLSSSWHFWRDEPMQCDQAHVLCLRQRCKHQRRRSGMSAPSLSEVTAGSTEHTTASSRSKAC